MHHAVMHPTCHVFRHAGFVFLSFSGTLVENVYFECSHLSLSAQHFDTQQTRSRQHSTAQHSTALPPSDTLLATSCAMVSNASVAVFCVVAVFGVVPALAIKGVDVSSLVLPSAFQCLRQNGYDFAVIRAWMETGEPDPDSPHTLYNAWHGGMKDVDVYLFPGAACCGYVCLLRPPHAASLPRFQIPVR